jgi:hypothetical protein
VYKPGSVTRQGLADEPIMRDDEAVIEHAMYHNRFISGGTHRKMSS